eukprot:jgi/Phyca11/14172/fgenesh1_pg.PHYCAscaffold_6_\
MSNTFTTRSCDVPSSSSGGNGPGDAPASATASFLQGGGDGTAVSPGGSSSAIAQAPMSPRDTVAGATRAADIRQGKHVSDSYGGPSCLVGYQYLSRDNVDELERVIPGFTEDDILRPRSMATNPRDLDGSLGSIAAQRELMSLLVHLPVDRLAERVFKTSGFLKIMASAHRRLRDQVEAKGASAMIDAAAVMNAPKNTDISGNWGRLHELLKLYPDNATSWDTVINITSLDKRRDPVPEFKEAFDKATAASSSPYVKSAGKSKFQKKSSPPKVQRRPSRHTPGKDSVRKAVRPDLRQSLLAGIKYEKAMAGCLIVRAMTSSVNHNW